MRGIRRCQNFENVLPHSGMSSILGEHSRKTQFCFNDLFELIHLLIKSVFDSRVLPNSIPTIEIGCPLPS